MFYRRNPDEDFRRLEKALQADPDNPELQEKYLRGLRRIGKDRTSSEERLSYLDRRDLAQAIEADHDCESSSCDISQALMADFEEVSAHLLLGAIEAPALEELLEEKELDLYGTNIFGQSYAWPRGWEEWTEYHAENAVECPECGAFNFDSDYCGECQTELIGEDDEDEEEDEI